MINQLNINDSFLHGNPCNKYIRYTADGCENEIYNHLAKLMMFIGLHSRTSLSIFNEKYLKFVLEYEVQVDENDTDLLCDKDKKIIEKVCCLKLIELNIYLIIFKRLKEMIGSMMMVYLICYLK